MQFFANPVAFLVVFEDWSFHVRYANDSLVFSPSDLVVYLDSAFASWMDRWHVSQGAIPNGEATAPLPLLLNGVECQRDEDDEESRLIARKGQEHEQKFLEKLRQTGCEIAELSLKHQHDSTLEAMQAGLQYIYQAKLEHENFAGYADFLVRTPGESELGEFHYEVWDTKLARSVKPSFIVQLCAYSEFLESIQQRKPHKFAVILGNGEQAEYEFQKYRYLYRHLKQRFLNFQEKFSPDQIPDPRQFKNHGAWSKYAGECLREVDHLSLVANISQRQIQKLEAAGISTLSALADILIEAVPKLNPLVFRRLQTQARLQKEANWTATLPYEVCIPPEDEPRRGLALLPPASQLDVYFDIEGFPLVDGGLEYLLGAVCIEQQEPRFFDWWAHDTAQERQSFQKFVEWVHDRWKSDPNMHVYHYAAYEVSAMRRLMGKHGVCERLVDDLLRNHVFVDLYTVVRQGLVIGSPGYSLKDIESLYGRVRQGEVRTAGGSVVAYHEWMVSGESQSWEKSPRLSQIRDYNRVDCESTWQLAQWLRERQKENGISYWAMKNKQEEPQSNVNDQRERADNLAQELLECVADAGTPHDKATQMQVLLAHLLGFHWREAKPVFWRQYSRNEMSEEELINDVDCLGGLQRTDQRPYPVARSMIYQYRYDPEQETKLHPGSACYFGQNLNNGVTIHSLDQQSGLVEIKKAGTDECSTLPARLSLIPKEYVDSQIIAEAVYRYVEAWSRRDILSSAIDDLLQQRAPRIRNHRNGDLIPSEADLLAGTIDIIQRMDHTVLCIQGPPGTGKTFTAAQAILALLEQGKTVGVTANSHKAILNVLRATHEAMQKSGRSFPIVKVGEAEDDSLIVRGEIGHLKNSADGIKAINGEPVLIGGTAWLFSRPEFEGQLDYLFVDEAGQFSLANTVGVGLSANNLVLVGDQMQLSQPLQGSHPGKSGTSALDYLLEGQATIPPEKGILLNQTWRLHPDICDFISSAFYEGKLRSHPRTEAQRIETSGTLITRQTGIHFVPVAHTGNLQSSREEVAMVQSLVRELLGASVWQKANEPPGRLTLQDILVVSPYNYQVRLLQDALGPQARVGTVDKFQGQEADVVIVSLASSTIEDAPRGVEFILEPNRLNVAISRAKALAILVGNPGLISGDFSSARAMELANLFCWLVEYAEGKA